MTGWQGALVLILCGAGFVHDLKSSIKLGISEISNKLTIILEHHARLEDRIMQLDGRIEESNQLLRAMLAERRR